MVATAHRPQDHSSLPPSCLRFASSPARPTLYRCPACAVRPPSRLPPVRSLAACHPSTLPSPATLSHPLRPPAAGPPAGPFHSTARPSFTGIAGNNPPLCLVPLLLHHSLHAPSCNTDSPAPKNDVQLYHRLNKICKDPKKSVYHWN